MTSSDNILPQASAETLLEKYRAKLIGMDISHVWFGHGSAIFLEFGRLFARTRPNGEPGNPDGEMGLMIQWGWRVEDRTSILCGSDSDEDLWKAAIADLKGRTVETLAVHGRLPELTLEFSGGRALSSFMTTDGEPGWALFDRQPSGETRSWLRGEYGQVTEEWTHSPSRPAL